jgi:hypothetical protein
MTVELLYFDGCPSYERLRPRLDQLLGEAGVREALELRRVESPEAAEAERFLGSPTVRVDGNDIDPGASERTDYGLKCRLYRSEQGASGVPPEAWIRSALERAKERATERKGTLACQRESRSTDSRS